MDVLKNFTETVFYTSASVIKIAGLILAKVFFLDKLLMEPIIANTVLQ